MTNSEKADAAQIHQDFARQIGMLLDPDNIYTIDPLALTYINALQRRNRATNAIRHCINQRAKR
jgi:hypothetical protein